MRFGILSRSLVDGFLSVEPCFQKLLLSFVTSARAWKLAGAADRRLVSTVPDLSL
jgi:hypothetical protein